jgi:hypothetical protein
MITDINEPAVVAEVTDAFTRYNAALVAGDSEALNGFFWNHPSTIRFGATENLFGYDEVSTFRSNQWKKKGPVAPRTTLRSVVTALDANVAVTQLLTKSEDGKLNRQTQVWVRAPEGWRIASAHVSAMVGA